jgi:peptidylprolyl isomerase
LQRALLHEAAAEKWEQRPEVAALLQRAHDQVLAESFLASHAAVPASYPAEADMRAAYDANISQFMQPRGYHLEQVFLPRAVYAVADDGRRNLQSLRAQLQHGRLSLQAAAPSLSGARYMDMGWVPEPQLVPEVKAAITGLPEGALTDAVCTANGCHLIRLIATRPAGPAPFSEARDQLLRALRQQKAAQVADAYAAGLLAKQPVAINEIQLSRMVP